MLNIWESLTVFLVHPLNASPDYQYSTYRHIAPFALFQVVHETR